MGFPSDWSMRIVESVLGCHGLASCKFEDHEGMTEDSQHQIRCQATNKHHARFKHNCFFTSVGALLMLFNHFHFLKMDCDRLFEPDLYLSRNLRAWYQRSSVILCTGDKSAKDRGY